MHCKLLLNQSVCQVNDLDVSIAMHLKDVFILKYTLFFISMCVENLSFKIGDTQTPPQRLEGKYRAKLRNRGVDNRLSYTIYIATTNKMAISSYCCCSGL